MHSQHSAATNPFHRTAKALIYVVDDEPAVADMVGELLKSYGWRVQAFTDPRLALNTFAAARPKPRVMILDFRMPEMDGLILYRKCKELDPQFKAIMLTGNMSAETFDHLASKPDIFIQKPTTGLQLRAAVENLLSTTTVPDNR